MKKILIIAYFLFFGCNMASSVLGQNQNQAKTLLRQKTENRLQKIIDHSSAIIGLAAVDLTNGETTFSFNSDISFPQASAIKIPILMEVYKQAHEGKFALSDKRTIEPTTMVGGSGILKSLEGPVSLSIQNICVLMITLSDNTATNILIDLVGMPAINQTLDNLGANQTRLRRKMMAIEASAKNRENVSTPIEAARILQILYNGEFINKEVSSEIISLLKKMPRGGSRLASGVPNEVPVAFKPGGLAGVSTEWAIILLEERPYAVAMMQNYMVENEDEKTTEKISALLYDYFWRMGNSTRYGVYRDPELMN